MLGRVSRKTKVVNRRTGWLDAIKADTSQSIERLKERVQDRKTRRDLALERIAKSRIRPTGYHHHHSAADYLVRTYKIQSWPFCPFVL